ncbi:MAG: RagB/SusD family nutrient uptake outer membrane protein [Bacteroidales bacterium]|nr:RagB/SusD family nutrient uptake outer membrane protein [Bacteroidales bacterium]
MKKIKNILLILALPLGFLSCTDLNESTYDKFPEGNYPENNFQASLALGPTYQALAPLIDDAGWWFWAQEISSDEIVFPVRLTDWEDGGKWKVLHTHEWDNNTDAINNMWSHIYDGIFEANLAIDLLPSSEEEATLISKAKLKTLRAYYYYLLIDNYGDVPYVTSFLSAPAQPEKETRENIYDAIVKDLEDNVVYLPDAANNFAVSKAMAYTLLAKLYLNAEVYTGVAEWEKAEMYCDKVMEFNYTLEGNPLDPFVAQNESSIENIFTIPFDESNLQGLRIHMRTLHYLSNQTFDMNVGPWNGFAVVEDHFNTYTDDDKRKEGFLYGPQFSSSGQALFDETAGANLSLNPHIPAIELTAAYTFQEIRMSGARVAKFEIEKGAKENMNNDFPIFRYADVLLMKAESLIRQGKNGDDYVNQVRSRAGVDTWNGVTLEMLLEERGREMFCEGHRRQDLIRFGKFTDSWWEKSASSSERNTFPIPQWAIDVNPNLAK